MEFCNIFLFFFLASDVSEISMPSTSKSSSIRQSTITESFKKIQRWDLNSDKAKEIHYLIGEMIALDNQPSSIVGDVGFTRLLKKALPQYNIASDKYFRENIIPDIYQRCRLKILTKLEHTTQKVSLTSDIWTCKHNNMAFLSSTAHWLVEETPYRCAFVLACKHFPGTHTGEAICKHIEDILKEWKIKRGSPVISCRQCSQHQKGS